MNVTRRLILAGALLWGTISVGVGAADAQSSGDDSAAAESGTESGSEDGAEGEGPRPTGAGGGPSDPDGYAGTESKTVVIDRLTAMRRAAAQNPQVVAERADVMKAEAQLGQVNAAKHPSLDMTLGVLTSLAARNSDAAENGVRSERRAYGDFDFDQIRPGFIARMSLVQPIYTFGKIGLREKAATSARDAAEAKIDIKSADIVLEVVSLYEAHLYAKEVLLFVADVKTVAGRSAQETQDRLEAGAFDVKKQDYLRLQYALGAAQLAANFAQSAIEQTREGLRAYLDYPPGTRIETEEAYLDPLGMQPSALEELLSMARERRPEVRALKQGIEAYQYLSRAENAGWLPNFFALGFVSAAYTPDRDWLQSRYVVDPFGHFVAGALVGAQWKVQWDMASARADEQAAEAFRLQNVLAWAEAGVPAEVVRFHEEVKRARADLKQLEETLPITKEWVIRASADFSAGFGDSREITDAVEAYVRMKNSQLQAVYRLNLGLASLAKATGTLVGGSALLYPGEEKP